MIAFLASLLGSLAGFFGQWMTKKAAIGTAALTALAALTLGFWMSIKGLINGVLVAAPGLCELSWLVPSNTAACVAVVISATVVRAVYDWHVENIKVLSYIT
ncbi:DUF5455 family protein [Thiobacillus sp. 65-1402]|uniref:DUF5455 family protein n=1 Tax=Thiobacillus sp. 65-1402 TaxID=1895861 RepID=UPI0009695341|nr:DUF5455 family protein [Thiobacillus sp. 65-1402]OJW81603.1 MAG: hypothetical protein BGO62_15505 [Thiobacillus sp. 65-1402]